MCEEINGKQAIIMEYVKGRTMGELAAGISVQMSAGLIFSIHRFLKNSLNYIYGFIVKKADFPKMK
jgi:hypothetical protein